MGFRQRRHRDALGRLGAEVRQPGSSHCGRTSPNRSAAQPIELSQRRGDNGI